MQWRVIRSFPSISSTKKSHCFSQSIFRRSRNSGFLSYFLGMALIMFMSSLFYPDCTCMSFLRMVNLLSCSMIERLWTDNYNPSITASVAIFSGV